MTEPRSDDPNGALAMRAILEEALDALEAGTVHGAILIQVTTPGISVDGAGRICSQALLSALDEMKAVIAGHLFD